MNELLLRSRRSKEVRDFHAEGRLPESWFLLKSATCRAVRALQAGGRVPYRLQGGTARKRERQAGESRSERPPECMHT